MKDFNNKICKVCEKLNTEKCANCNKETILSWKIACSIGGEMNEEENLTNQDKFENWMDNSPAFDKDCTDMWEEKEDDGSTTLVYCYWFKVDGGKG